MEKSILTASETYGSRLSFIESSLNMSEKLLLSKFNSVTTNEQNDMLEFLYNNNSTIHSSNQKIILNNNCNMNNSLAYDNVFDKGLDSYIMQYSIFPFIDEQSNEENNHSGGSKGNKAYSFKTNKIKTYRMRKIEDYLQRKKKLFKSRIHSRGISCFTCFGQRSFFSQQQKSPMTAKDIPNIQVKNQEIQIKKRNDCTNNCMPLDKLENAPQQINTNDVSNMQINQSSNQIANDIMVLNNNSNKSQKEHFPMNTQGITFILTNDIIKPISLIAKGSSYEYIIHSFTYLFDKNALFNDLYFYELKLRTNIEKILPSKNIKYPLLLYGNVFIPQLVFFRGDEEVSFRLLDHPIISPMIIGQLIPDSFINKADSIQIINYKIIEETMTLSDNLNYETILVNLLPIADSNQILSIIKNYIEAIKNNMSYNINSVNFLLNTNEEQFQSYVTSNDINQIVENANLKSNILSL